MHCYAIELISKPWAGSILDLGEPDPGGRHRELTSNGRSFNPCFLPRLGPGGPGPMIARGSYMCWSRVVVGRICLGDRGRIKRRGDDPKNLKRRGSGRRSFGRFWMEAMPRGRWRWRRWGWIPRRSKRKEGHKRRKGTKVHVCVGWGPGNEHDSRRRSGRLCGDGGFAPASGRTRGGGRRPRRGGLVASMKKRITPSGVAWSGSLRG